MMTLRNNKLLKQRFFALYWGQNIFNYKRSLSKRPFFYEPEFAVQVGAWCELRSVSDMTEEEAIEVAKIVWPVAKDLQTADNGRNYFYPNSYVSIPIADYLRSVGIAVSFMNHEVEDMVKAGWIKLIKS